MSKKLSSGDFAPDFALMDGMNNTVRLSDYERKSLIVIFTRYVGCPVCQMDTINYAKAYSRVTEREMELIVVFQSAPEILKEYVGTKILPYIALSDVQRQSYSDYHVKSGVGGFLSPKNIGPLLKSVRQGNRHGKFEGNEFQYPAVFVLDKNHKISFAYYGKTITDSLSIENILENLD